MSNISNVLREERKERNQPQKEVASILGVPLTTYSNWERGCNEPDCDMLIKIATLYDISTDYLLGAHLADIITRPEMRPQVKKVTQSIDKLNDMGIAMVIGYVARLLEQKEYKRS